MIKFYKEKMTTKFIVQAPADVPKDKEQTYINNYKIITKNTGKLLLFAYDQKIEHLHDDFYGENIHPDAADPLHAFEIASKGAAGAFATHLGLITRYGNDYKNINYIVKLNGKTNLIKKEHADPVSTPLCNVDDVVAFAKDSGLNICGIGATIYLGSEHEDEMLSFAAQEILQAHQHGLVTILWIYPRGKSVTDEDDPMVIAGAAGVAHSLGSDFVKVRPPREKDGKTSAQWLKVAVEAAGNTKVICSGGAQKKPKDFLQELHDQLIIGSVAGSATGRNIFQHSREKALDMTRAIAALVYDNKTVEQAMALIERLN